MINLSIMGWCVKCILHCIIVTAMCISDESQFRSFLISRFPCELVTVYQLKIYVISIEV